MAVDKAVNQAPLGRRYDNVGVQEGVNSYAVTDTGEYGEEPELPFELEIDLGEGDEGAPDTGEESDEEDKFSENLADMLDDSQLAELAGALVSEFEDDVNARKDWIQTYVDGLDLLGLKMEDRTEPWPGACGIYHPMLSEALVKFQAETMMETFPARGPVRTELIGKETPEKKEAAARVEEDMNYQLTDVMVEYRPEHERMLWGLGLAGNAFKKVYYDPSLARQTAMYVPAEDVVVPYGASSIETAERVTHVMRKTPNEVAKLQAAGFYRGIDLPEPADCLDEIEKAIADKMGFRATTDDRYKLLEMHVNLILEDDKEAKDEAAKGVALPYVVTIDKGTTQVLAVRRNWNPDDKLKNKRNHFVHYGYIPGFGFYAFGLIHLIGAFAKSGTSLIRQLVDAGTLSNLPGGFKTKGLRVKGDDTPIGPGEFRDVDVASGAMRDNIMPLPYKEPSQVLYSLLNTIVEEGRRFAGAADLQVSDMSANAPVGTTLAILERTLKTMSAVQARIHYSMKQEFGLLKAIIRDYTPEEYSYEPEEGGRRAKQSDYDQVAVIPVSDPNAATMAQKIVQYQAVIQLAQGAPQIYDLPYLHRQMLEVLGIKNAAKLVPLKDGDDMKPRDPVSENMDIINGKPVKAFIYQDHEAHITVHMSAMQDPKIMQLLGQNPNAQAMQAAMLSHIAEHLAFEYRKQIEEQAGVPMPPPGSDMSEDTEIQISRLAAAAAAQLLQKNQAEAEQAKNQQTAQDPIVQMQMQELEIKKGELELKKKRLEVDAVEKADKLELDEKRLAMQQQIAGLQVGAKMATDKANLSAKEQADGLRIGVDVARAQLDQQNRVEEGRRSAMMELLKGAMAEQQTEQSETPVEGEDE